MSGRFVAGIVAIVCLAETILAWWWAIDLRSEK